jgi:hypothetical protein
MDMDVSRKNGTWNGKTKDKLKITNPEIRVNVNASCCSYGVGDVCMRVWMEL